MLFFFFLFLFPFRVDRDSDAACIILQVEHLDTRYIQNLEYYNGSVGSLQMRICIFSTEEFASNVLILS